MTGAGTGAGKDLDEAIADDLNRTEDKTWYLYDFHRRRYNTLVDGQLFEPNGASRVGTDDETGTLRNLAFAIQAANNQFILVSSNPFIKVTINKNELAQFQEVNLQVGDIIEFNKLKFLVIDNTDLTEEEAKRYIGRLLLSNNQKFMEDQLNKATEELLQINRDLDQARSMALKIKEQYEKIALYKKTVMDMRAKMELYLREISNLEKMDLPNKYKPVALRIKGLEETLSEKEKEISRIQGKISSLPKL